MSDDRFPGARIIFGCFVVLTTSGGLGFYGLAVYLNSFNQERGWDVSSVSLATTLFFFVSGFAGLVIARVIKRLDVRWIIVAGGVVSAGSLVLLGRVAHQWQLFVVYAVFALGFAASGLLPVTTVITRWFHVRRSVALSLASTGLSVGGILLTPASKWLLDERGLAAGTPWLALAYLIGVVPFTLWLVRPDPAALGWHPDGERVIVGAAPREAQGMPYLEARRHRFYLAVTIGYVLALGSQVGAIQQLVRLVEERSSKSNAAFATLALAAMSVIGRLVGGRLVGRFPMMRFTVMLAVGQVAAMCLLAIAESTVLLFVAIIMFGVTVGNLLMMQPLLLAERFGVRDYAQIFSRSQFFAVFGTAGGPILLGWLHDHGGGYRASYLVAAACSLVGAGVLALGGPATVAES